MLVFKRKRNEEIVINGNIRVMVTEIGDRWVKVGVKAPRSITVNRAEIQSAIEAGMPDPKAAGGRSC